MADHVSRDQLADYIGKDAAEKLLQQKPNQAGHHILNGIDLKLGGEWANALYDRAIPNFLRGYAKKWGAKVGQTNITSGNSFSIEYGEKWEKEPWHVVQNGLVVASFLALGNLKTQPTPFSTTARK